MPAKTTHQAFLAGLPAEAKAGLMRRSDRAGLLHLAAHGGLIVLVGGLIATGVPGWPLLLPVQGLLLTFLFTLEHECTHQTPFARLWLSEVVGRLCGLVLVLPFQWFRYFHLAHHRFTNLAGLDPELAAPKPATRPAWLWHISGLPYWGAQMRLLVRLLAGREQASWLPARALPRIRTEAVWMTCVYGLVLLSLIWSPLLIWVWLLPALLGQPVLRLYLLAEHGDCPMVADMFENTRTTFTTAVVRFLAWNMPFHTEHHVVPAVPFFRLPALHQTMRQHLQVTEAGYGAFTKSYLARRP